MTTSSEPRNEIRQEIKQILETTARVDERFKTMVERQAEFFSRLNVISDQLANLQSRMAMVESKNGDAAKKYAEEVSEEVRQLTLRLERMELVGTLPAKKAIEQIDEMEPRVDDVEKRVQDLEKDNADWANRLKLTGVELFKIILAMFAAYLLFRMGVKQ